MPSTRSSRIKPPSGAPSVEAIEVTEERTEAKHGSPFGLSDNGVVGLADGDQETALSQVAQLHSFL